MSTFKATFLAAQTLVQINFPVVCPPCPSFPNPFVSFNDRLITFMAANVKCAQAVPSVNAQEVSLGLADMEK